ncbi:MAG: methyltransferase domain-containing protein [Candidatus Omnitrophica bacterium]|nr:methyltransferase domain-containing protein [Candidatus Omnitrophota bacterium]
MRKNNFVKIDDWVKDIIVDPLSKQALRLSGNGEYLLSSYGRKYPIIGGVYDLRLLNNETTYDQKIWKKGQIEFMKYSRSEATSDNTNYDSELNGVREVYEEIPIDGTCLDVGGHQGKLRAFLEANQKYISCDPYLNIFDKVAEHTNLIKTYPFLLEPVNFLSCDAEFLPFKSCVFQIVHMRSVIDHFLNPELALNEAYRVLENKGSLIVGVYVNGGKQGKVCLKDRIKENIRTVLPYFGIHKYTDHHVWRATYKELTDLISACGFEIIKAHWQKGYSDTVCYIRALKKVELTRNFI